MLDVSIEHKLGEFGLSLDLKAETGITALFGRSGCGKTTLVNILAGLETPQQGRVRIGDTVLFDSSKHINLPPEKRRVGYVFQDSRLFPHMTVEKNLIYGQARVHPGMHCHSVSEIVDLLALSPILNRRPGTLSGGEKQRVAIGRALLSGPNILLMDEPLASLDAAHRAEILPFIERLGDEVGIPIVYVSHALDEVIRLADTIAVMSDGKISASGSVEDVLSRLDLGPLTGRYETGAVILTTVTRHHDLDGLSELSCPAGTFAIPKVHHPVGANIRLRVRARDVSLATEKPVATSILNVFQGQILEIERDGIPSQADILVNIGVPIIARITRRSIRDLGLAPGKAVYVMVKAAAIDRQNKGMWER
jgi:molybdate transport system ATP-binding protein